MTKEICQFNDDGDSMMFLIILISMLGEMDKEALIGERKNA